MSNASVNDIAPLIGQPINKPPTTTASTAESNDHQKPGARFNQNVVIRPTRPLMRKSQPKKIVTVSVAQLGRIMAAAPITTSKMPSIK
jgi:hypothetical protein